MTDRYERIRKALARRPTPGPWELRDGRTDTVESTQGYPVCTVHWQPDERYGHGTRAAYIAACDPDTIRELLAERDALLDALRQITEWPDGGNRYGQENIKRFAQAAIDAAMRKENSDD